MQCVRYPSQNVHEGGFFFSLKINADSLNRNRSGHALETCMLHCIIVYAMLYVARQRIAPAQMVYFFYSLSCRTFCLTPVDGNELSLRGTSRCCWRTADVVWSPIWNYILQTWVLITIFMEMYGVCFAHSDWIQMNGPTTTVLRFLVSMGSFLVFLVYIYMCIA